MATCSNVNKSVATGSEEMVDICCSPCLEDGISKEAKKFCVECEMHYCEQCLKAHAKIPVSRGHQIVDRLGQDTESSARTLLFEPCLAHHGQILESYCREHDVVCCRTCLLINHRSCMKIETLSYASKGIKDSQEYTNTQSDVADVLTKLHNAKEKRLQTLSSIQHEKNDSLEKVNAYEEELVKKIKELAEKSRNDIFAKENDLKKLITKELESLDAVISLVTLHKQKMSAQDDVKTFVHAKAVKTIVEEGRELLQECSESHNVRGLDVELDQSFKQFVDTSNSFINIAVKESLENPREYKAVLSGKFPVHHSITDITATCLLQNGSLVIFAWRETCLKRFSTSDFKLIDQLSMNGCSYSVCAVGDSEVAVVIDQSVQFVHAAQSMVIASSFACKHGVYAVEFFPRDKHLFVTSGTKTIYVYDKNGTQLRSFNFPGENSKHLAFINHQKQPYILVTDETSGLYATDHSGSLLWKFTDPELTRTWGVTVLPGNIILISAIGSHKVIQLDRNGQKLGSLFVASETLKQPWSFAYDRRTKKLIIGSTSDSLFVYKLTQQ